MTRSRLPLAFPVLPEGRVLVVGARAGDDLAPLAPARTVAVQPNAPDHAALAARGFGATPDWPADDAPFAAGVVMLPRARALARDWVHAAAARLPDGAPLWIDGARTDGIEAMLRDLRNLKAIADVHARGHGKIARVAAGAWVPADWVAQPGQPAPGFVAPPGAFSADGIDPGSALLAAHLPDRMPTRMVDLGAGWGWLSAQVLARPGVATLHLVEADHASLAAARRNVADPRAQFHWADARDWTLPEPVNGVVMNPPFHAGRDADPGLGRAFIAAAARLLTGAGRLWMVANRHLPYEATLSGHFARVDAIGGDGRFKILQASGARRPAAPGGPRR